MKNKYENLQNIFGNMQIFTIFVSTTTTTTISGAKVTKNVKTFVNELLKILRDMKKQQLRALSEVAAEIRECEKILSCYNHFIPSYEASQMPVANVQIQLNRIVIKKTLRELHAEWHEVRTATLPPMVTEARPVTMETYIASPLEEAAIIAFNTDKRYCITE